GPASCPAARTRTRRPWWHRARASQRRRGPDGDRALRGRAQRRRERLHFFPVQRKNLFDQIARTRIRFRHAQAQMKRLPLLLFLSRLLFAQTAQQHEFTIVSFKTESGATLPAARIVYGTYGQLNAAGDNAVLLPSHYMANLHGYEWLIGPGKA